jgi:hypothetical protein
MGMIMQAIILKLKIKQANMVGCLKDTEELIRVQD